MKNKKIIYIFLACLFFAFGLFFHSYLDRDLTEADMGVDTSLFWETWNILEEKYPFKEPSNQDKIFGAISGLVSAYGDQHMAFFPPAKSEFFAQNIAGEFGGAGMEISVENGFLVVIAPLKGSVAERAGIEPGDVILSIDGIKVSGLDFDTAVSMIRGEIGTSLRLEVMHLGESKEIEIMLIRESVHIPILNTEIIDNVFIIHFYSFTENSEYEFKKALDEFKTSGKTHLLIDLRNNPGGFLSSAINVTSHFLDQGLVIVKEDSGQGNEQIHTYRSLGYNTLDGFDYDISLLINRGSASASEIVAGALRDHKKATIYGTTSFGKGSVQELLNLSKKTSLKVTIAKWLTPNDIEIAGTGIVPDVIFYENELEETLNILNN